MSDLRAKIRWTVPGAGTAFSVLHFGQRTGATPDATMAEEVVSRVDTFCSSIRPMLPPAVSIQAVNEVEVIEPTTGELLNVVNAATKLVRVGSSATTTWSAPVGAVITWQTATVLRGRRIRGRTFIVPCATNMFDTDGTLSGTAVSTLDSAATALRTAGTLTELVVYARPTGPAATDGSGGVVTSHRVPDMAAVLRSRRS